MEQVATAATGDNGASATAAAPSASQMLSGAASPTSTAAATAGAPAAPAAENNWLTGAPEDIAGYAANKGWKDPGEVVKSYQNLEKLLGADRAGNTLVMPKADAPQQEWDAFYNRLGRPADPKEYGIAAPEGADPTFATEAAAKFHELGLTAKQAQELVSWYEGKGSAIEQQSEVSRIQEFQKQHAELRASWGMKFDENLVVARNTMNALGLDGNTIDALEGAMGHKGVMELLVRIGSKSGEADFVTNGVSNFNGSLTPAQAKSAIKTKMEDTGFVTRYLNKDADAVAEMERLHKYAAG